MKKGLFTILATIGLFISLGSPGYCQNWGALGTGVPSTVNCIVRYNGSIYAAGDSIYNWNGSRWSVVATGMLYPLGVGVVYSLAVFNSALYAGGIFTVLTPDGNWYNDAGRLSNGSWTTCGSGKGNDGSGMSDYVNCLAVFNGSVYAGGNFGSAGGDPLAPQDAAYIARFDGTQWYPVGTGMNDRITDMVVFSNQLVVSGYFTTAGGVNANYIASWNGTAWSSLGSGTDGKVTALAVHNGYLYAGGSFTQAGGIAAANIARWDGHSWSAVGDGLMGQVYTLASYNDKLYAGGYNLSQIFLSTPPYTISQHILCWNGSKWDSLGSGTDGSVDWLLSDSSGLLVGGSFTKAGNISANNFAVYSTVTAINEPVEIPRGFSLDQNFPNPFNPVTIIRYQLSRNAHAALKVYDVLGREVARLVDGVEAAGYHEVTFDGSGLASGVYFYRLTTPGFSETNKMLLMK